MDANTRRILVCSCERSMRLDPAALAQGCGGAVETAHQLCRAELGRFEAALAGGGPVLVGCVQEAPRFEEAAAAAGFDGRLDFANLRETAGWSAEGASAGPKMAALLAAASVEMPPIRMVELRSAGVALILGRDGAAIEAGRRLAEALDVTVLLAPGAEAAPPPRTDFPVLQGRVRAARGHLGAFVATVDAFAAPDPSSRAQLRFGPARDGATSQADLILDLGGGAPLFPAHDLRDGYLRADTRDPLAVERAVFDAARLVGAFDRPAYVDFDAGLCAHSRSRITGCTRCLDLCPTAAIAPAGDSVAIDPMVCAGCGQCAAACPTGAAAYALPPAGALVERLRALTGAFAAAGGTAGVVLFHDDAHGAALIEAAARHGAGLPARVLPVAVNATTALGPAPLAAALAYGAAAVRVLSRSRPRHDDRALRDALALTAGVAAAFGYGAEAVGLIETDDPDGLAAALAALPPAAARPAPERFLPPAEARSLTLAAFRALGRDAPAPAHVAAEAVALAPGAPFGAVVLDEAACTLCLACVSACPTGALGDDPDRPLLSFDEAACVQCGLCAATCPEDALALAPRLDLAAWDAGRRVLKDETPLPCADCGRPFAAPSTIARVRDRLAGHWMYSGPDGAARRRVLELCDDCRVAAMIAESFDPHARPPVRTTADYLRERAESAPQPAGAREPGPQGST